MVRAPGRLPRPYRRPGWARREGIEPWCAVLSGGRCAWGEVNVSELSEMRVDQEDPSRDHHPTLPSRLGIMPTSPLDLSSPLCHSSSPLSTFVHTAITASGQVRYPLPTDCHPCGPYAPYSHTGPRLSSISQLSSHSIHYACPVTRPPLASATQHNRPRCARLEDPLSRRASHAGVFGRFRVGAPCVLRRKGRDRIGRLRHQPAQDGKGQCAGYRV